MPTAAAQSGIAGSSASTIVASVESAVTQGLLRPGAALPSVRALARELGVSPPTVARAYQLLQARGVVVAHERSRTRVSARPPVPVRYDVVVPPGVRNLATGNPDPALLPALRPALRRIPVPHRLYDDAPVLPELAAAARERIAGLGVDAEAVTLAHGAMDGVERVLAAHLRPGDHVAVEDPGFGSVFDVAGALGLVARPVPVDESGLVPDELARAIGAGARAVVLTPRAQNPTGAVLSPSRCRELRAVLRGAPDLLVVEDDYAGLVSDAPYRTLTAGRRRWAYVQSVAKALGPDLRLALVAGDPETVTRVEWRLSLGSGWVSTILQRLVVAAWTDRRVGEVVDRAARRYAARRDALLEALAGHGTAATGRSGFNVWIPVPHEPSVVQGLLQRGWAVRAGERYRLASPPAVRVTTAALLPAEAGALAADLAAVLRPGRRTRLA